MRGGEEMVEWMVLRVGYCEGRSWVWLCVLSCGSWGGKKARKRGGMYSIKYVGNVGREGDKKGTEIENHATTSLEN